MFINKFASSNFTDNAIYSKSKESPETPEKDGSKETFKAEYEYSFQYNPDTPHIKYEDTVTIGIIHINDEHDNTFKKLPREAAIVKNRGEYYGDKNSFVVNLGDITYNGNTKEKSPAYFGPVVDIFNAMDVEFFVPGNHDFQHGGKYLEKEVISNLKATTLLGNVTYKSNEPLAETQPYIIEEINGVKVGLIGITTPKHKKEGKDIVGNDVIVSPIQENVEKYVGEVKKEGADLVVLLMHEGVNTARAIAGSVSGIDVIIAGHDHKKCAEEVKNPDGKNTLVLEAGGNTNYVGDIAIKVEADTKKITSVDYKLFSTRGLTPDKEALDIIREFKAS